MFIKLLSVVCLTGALLVGADATIRSVTASTPAPSTCCQVEQSCCAVNGDCCAATYSYCTRTGDIYEGCCCEVVNGLYRCLITGEVSDECCCIPLD